MMPLCHGQGNSLSGMSESARREQRQGREALPATRVGPAALLLSQEGSCRR